MKFVSVTKGKPVKVCLVQPVQSPYWTERLRVLARNTQLRVSFLMERAAFAHRPGWRPEPIEGVDIGVLGSAIAKSVRTNDDLGYRIHGVRAVPWRLPFVLWRAKPDVVVLCNATQLLFALPLKLILGMRLALIVEDTPHATRNLGWLSRRVKRWAYRRANTWFAFSNDAVRFLAGIGIQKNVRRSSWSLDMARFAPQTHVADKLARVPLTFLYVGQFVPGKGIMPLLEAWRQLPETTRRKARLVMVGDGPLREAAAQFVQQHGLNEVELAGQRPYDEVRELMQSASCFVLPTMQDLFSLTVLEAMACGCPVITTPYNGAQELVSNGKNGWLADPTQPGALTAALENALSATTDLESMGRAARERVVAMDNRQVMEQFANDLIALANDGV